MRPCWAQRADSWRFPMQALWHTGLILFFSSITIGPASSQDNGAKDKVVEKKVTKAPWTIPVLVINYFPLTPDKKNIDIKVTSNVGAPLNEIEAKCKKQTKETITALEEGSRFRAY